MKSATGHLVRQRQRMLDSINPWNALLLVIHRSENQLSSKKGNSIKGRGKALLLE